MLPLELLEEGKETLSCKPKANFSKFPASLNEIMCLFTFREMLLLHTFTLWSKDRLNWATYTEEFLQGPYADVINITTYGTPAMFFKLSFLIYLIVIFYTIRLFIWLFTAEKKKISTSEYELD